MRKLLVFLLFTFGTSMHLIGSENPIEMTPQGICRINEIEYPVVGFGTYPLTGKTCTKAVKRAIKTGYRIFDTATYYENFHALAKVLKNVDRADFYIISKVWHDKQSPQDLRQDLNLTLDQLETPYLDAYFLHFPNSQIPIEETLSILEEFRQNKKIRHIGLSNVNVNHLKRALEAGIPITWVQIEMHPLFYDQELLQFCEENSIKVQAWAPLARGRLCEDPLLERIGEKYGKTASQVAIRWVIQHGCMPLPASKNKKHIKENFDVFDFTLSAEDIEEIDSRAKVGSRERWSTEDLGFQDELGFSYEECWPKKLSTDLNP